VAKKKNIATLSCGGEGQFGEATTEKKASYRRKNKKHAKGATVLFGSLLGPGQGGGKRGKRDRSRKQRKKKSRLQKGSNVPAFFEKKTFSPAKGQRWGTYSKAGDTIRESMIVEKKKKRSSLEK